MGAWATLIEVSPDAGAGKMFSTGASAFVRCGIHRRKRITFAFGDELALNDGGDSLVSIATAPMRCVLCAQSIGVHNLSA